MWPLRATERHFGEVKMSANIEKIDIDIALRFPPQMQLCGTGESTKSTPASSSALGFSPTLCLSIRFSIIKQGGFFLFLLCFKSSGYLPHICNFICLCLYLCHHGMIEDIILFSDGQTDEGTLRGPKNW